MVQKKSFQASVMWGSTSLFSLLEIWKTAHCFELKFDSIKSFPSSCITLSVFSIIFCIVQVECPKYPGFCITRQKKEYPFVEIFHSPEQVLLLSRGIICLY